MLRKVNECGVISDSGFSIQITAPEVMEYRLNGNVLRMDVNYDPAKRKVYIYASDITQWTTGTNDLIAADEKKNIINNIKEAVKLLTGDFEVV